MAQEKLWFKSYQKNIPHEISLPQDLTIYDVVKERCIASPDITAFINYGKSISYGEFFEKVEALAAFFQNHYKLKKGDKIAVQLPNLIQTPIVIFAAFRAGLTVVMTNPLYTAQEMLRQFNDSQVKAVVILENFLSKLEKIIDDTDVEHVLATRVGDLLNFPKNILIDFVIKYVKQAVPAYGISPLWFNDVVRIGKNYPLTAYELKPDDLAFLQYTGGTTGVPKAAMLTHRNIVSNMWQMKAWISQMPFTHKDLVCSPLPFYHIFSLTCNCIIFIKLGVPNLLITNPKDVKHFIKELRSYPITVITGVNTLFAALLRNKYFHKIKWDKYRLIISGGASLQKAVAEEFKVRTNKKIKEGYGLTEASPIVTIAPFSEEYRIGSVGLPVPNTDIKLVGENGEEVKIGEPGELLVKGPQVMAGYWQRDEETKNTFKDGYFKTGDIAVMDEDGFVTLVDRKKDLILVSGFNVYPAEVEQVLSLHPAILECAIVGIGDVQTGERPVGAVVLKEGCEVGGKELRMHCKKHLTNYKIPRDFIFFKELPKTNVGKVLRREVKEKIIHNGGVRK